MLACQWLGGADLQLSGASIRVKGQRFFIEVLFLLMGSHGWMAGNAPLVNKTKHYKRLSTQSTIIGVKSESKPFYLGNGATLFHNLGLRDEPGATDNNMAKCKVATPMIAQYLEVKEGQQNALLFYRMGDFYEMFLRMPKSAPMSLALHLPNEVKAMAMTFRCAGCRSMQLMAIWPA